MKFWNQILNVFNNLTLKKFSEKRKHFLKNWSTTIQSVRCPYKTALSESKVKANRMGITKWTYDKERSFASSYFLFQYNSLL